MRFKITLDRPQSAEKPVSLHPLSFKEAIRFLARVEPPSARRRPPARVSEKPGTGSGRQGELD